MLCKYNYSYAKLVAAMLHLAKQQEVKALLLPTQNKTQSKQQHQSLNILVGLLYINNREGNLFNMGFWKDVAYDMQRGMTKEQAIKLNATLRYGKPEEKKKAETIAEANLKINTMP